MQSNEHPWLEAVGQLERLLATKGIRLTAITVATKEQRDQFALELWYDNGRPKLISDPNLIDYLVSYNGVWLRHD